MTDRDRSLDELVSAYLDGEATAEERARVEADPDLQARATEFAAVRDAVRAEVPVLADGPRDALLARVVGTAIAPPNVVPLHRRRGHPAKVLAVAAAVVAIAFLGGALALLTNDRGGSDNSDDSGGATAMSSNDAFEAAPGDGDGRGGDSSAPDSAAQSVPYEYLGPFADEGALRAAVRDRIDNEALDMTTSDADRGALAVPAAPSCQTGTDVVYRAELAGQPVLVLVGDATVTVLATGDCSIVASFPR